MTKLRLPEYATRIAQCRARAWSTVCSSLLIATLTLATAVHAADLSLEARRADFAELATLVSDQYVYLDGRRARWSTVGERYRARVDAATTADAWSAVVEDALAELRDFHAGMNPGSARRWLAVPTSADLWAVADVDGARVVAVRAGTDAARADIVVGERIVEVDGQAMPVAMAQLLQGGGDADDADARAWAVLALVTGRYGEKREFVVRGRDGATRKVTLPVQRRVDRPTEPVTWSRLPDGVGVIRFNNSLGRQETVAAFDAALLALRDTRGLVVDLRDTPSGGNSGVALGVMGRFVDRRMPYQRHRVPRYGQDDVERNWVEEIAPRGPFTYRAPVVVLVGHWTGSMGEGMAIGFDAARVATVAGTTMGRLQGANDGFTLARTGVHVSFPTEALFHVDGTPRHRWVPPVLVPEPEGPAGEDGALAYARKRLLEGAPQR